MDDIVKRLRDPENNWNSGGRFEAANEIERLTACLKMTREWLDRDYMELPKDRYPGPATAIIAMIDKTLNQTK